MLYHNLLLTEILVSRVSLFCTQLCGLEDGAAHLTLQ